MQKPNRMLLSSYHKYTMGAELRQLSREALQLIRLALAGSGWSAFGTTCSLSSEDDHVSSHAEGGSA